MTGEEHFDGCLICELYVTLKQMAVQAVQDLEVWCSLFVLCNILMYMNVLCQTSFSLAVVTF